MLLKKAAKRQLGVPYVNMESSRFLASARGGIDHLMPNK